MEVESILYQPHRTLEALEEASSSFQFEDVHRTRKARLKRSKARAKRKRRSR